MKNPFKGIAEKIKAAKNRFLAPTPYDAKKERKANIEYSDTTGNLAIGLGGVVVLLAVFNPVVAGGALATGAVFVAGGIGAKLWAARLKAKEHEASSDTPASSPSPGAANDAPSLQPKAPGPEFRDAAEPAGNPPVRKPDVSTKKPETPKP